MRHCIIAAVLVCGIAMAGAEEGGVTWSGSVLTDFAQPLGAGSSGGALTISEISVGVHADVTTNLAADVIVLAEENLEALAFDEAYLSYRLRREGAMTFRFGQTVQPFGVLHTHLISDPAIIDYVETVAPSVVAAFDGERVQAALSAFTADGTSGGIVRAAYAFVPALAFDVSVLGRDGEALDLDAALIMDGIGDRFAVDLEGYTALNRLHDGPKPWGAALGLAAMVTDRFEAAVRMDALADTYESAPTVSVATGGTYELQGGLSIAAEISGTPDDERGSFALQFGAEF